VAYDLTPTKNRAIIVGGILAAATLFSLHYVFDSYFIAVTEGVQHDKLASPEQLLATRAAERKALAGGPVTLDNAMAQLARQGRAGVAGGVDIAPKQSEDIGALTGWNKMPRPAEQFAGAKPDLAGSLANGPVGDGGVADAGVPLSAIPGHAGAGDAGATVSTDGDAGPKYNPQR
jgi:hypothetical protein